MLQIYLSLLDSAEEKSKFEQLYERYVRLMHYVACGILGDPVLAEDAVQEALIRVAKNFHKVGDVESAATRNFLAKITENVAKSMLAKMGQDVSIEEIGEETGGKDIPTDFNAFSVSEIAEEVHRLPDIYRDVLYLHKLYDYSIRETANLLGISAEATKKRLQRGQKLLRAGLERE